MGWWKSKTEVAWPQAWTSPSRPLRCSRSLEVEMAWGCATGRWGFPNPPWEQGPDFTYPASSKWLPRNKWNSLANYSIKLGRAIHSQSSFSEAVQGPQWTESRLLTVSLGMRSGRWVLWPLECHFPAPGVDVRSQRPPGSLFRDRNFQAELGLSKVKKG